MSSDPYSAHCDKCHEPAVYGEDGGSLYCREHSPAGGGVESTPLWWVGGPGSCLYCGESASYLHFSTYGGGTNAQWLCEDHHWEALIEEETDDHVRCEYSFVHADQLRWG